MPIIKQIELKTLIFALLSMGISAGNSCEIPKMVLQAFERKYADADHVSWLYERQLYHATFRQDDLQTTASFEKRGDWVRTITQLDIEFPETCLVEYINSKYDHAEIFDIYIVEVPGSSKYEMVIRVSEDTEVEEREEIESVYEFYKLSFTTDCELIGIKIHVG